MDRETAKKIQDHMAKAMVDVMEKYGLRIKTNRISYSDMGVNITIKLVVADKSVVTN